MFEIYGNLKLSISLYPNNFEKPMAISEYPPKSAKIWMVNPNESMKIVKAEKLGYASGLK